MPGADENSYILEIGIMECFTCASHSKPRETSTKGTKRLTPFSARLRSTAAKTLLVLNNDSAGYAGSLEISRETPVKVRNKFPLFIQLQSAFVLNTEAGRINVGR